jgi:histone acetyltransferase SAS3
LKKIKARIPGTSSIIKHYTPIPIQTPAPKIDFDKDEDGNQLYFGGKLDHIEGDTSKATPSKPDRDAYKLALSRSLKTLNPTLKPQKTHDTSLPKIPQIQFGNYKIDTWFAAPYPLEFTNLSILYICEFCLKYMNSSFTLQRHSQKCVARHPPGDEIYRDESLSIFEVDGRKNKVLNVLIKDILSKPLFDCQNLS